MTNESGDDLIVSFAVDQDVPREVLSVILMRTPKFEHLPDPAERGVRVSHERYPDSDDEYLRRFVLRDGVAEIATRGEPISSTCPASTQPRSQRHVESSSE